MYYPTINIVCGSIIGASLSVYGQPYVHNDYGTLGLLCTSTGLGCMWGCVSTKYKPLVMFNVVFAMLNVYLTNRYMYRYNL